MPLRISAVKRGESRLGGEHSSQVVGDGHARPDGRSIRFACQIEQPAVRDAEPVETGALAVGAVLAERADPHPNESRVELCWADVPGFERPRSEVLTDDVGTRGEPAEQFLTLGLPKVAGDALLPLPSTAQNNE